MTVSIRQDIMAAYVSGLCPVASAGEVSCSSYSRLVTTDFLKYREGRSGSMLATMPRRSGESKASNLFPAT
ncbi:hypothetical protein B7W85_13645 [Allorhizobium ampelinum]|nr:hypothetical protein B7W85_13645 [Allorhizobium ampelinum]